MELKQKIGKFSLCGLYEPSKKGETFSLETASKNNPNWIQNVANLPIYCGEKYGKIFVNIRGGYLHDNPRPIKKPSIGEDGSADYSNMVEIDWNGRKEPYVKDEVHYSGFIKVKLDGVEESFLHEYDLVEYLSQNLKPNTPLNIWGDLRWNYYNGNVNRDFEIKGITDESRGKKIDPEEIPYRATFRQTVLLDRNSVGKLDKDKGACELNARIPTRIGKLNGVQLNDVFVLPYKFEFKFPNIEDTKQVKAITKKFLKPEKGITEITFDGEIYESGSTVSATFDDLSDDIKLLVELGMKTEEEVLAECSTGSIERRMVCTSINIRNTKNDDGTNESIIQFFPNAYDKEIFDKLPPKDGEESKAKTDEEISKEEEDIFGDLFSDDELPFD